MSLMTSLRTILPEKPAMIMPINPPSEVPTQSTSRHAQAGDQRIQVGAILRQRVVIGIADPAAAPAAWQIRADHAPAGGHQPLRQMVKIPALPRQPVNADDRPLVVNRPPVDICQAMEAGWREAEHEPLAIRLPGFPCGRSPVSPRMTCPASYSSGELALAGPAPGRDRQLSGRSRMSERYLLPRPARNAVRICSKSSAIRCFITLKTSAFDLAVISASSRVLASVVSKAFLANSPCCWLDSFMSCSAAVRCSDVAAQDLELALRNGSGAFRRQLRRLGHRLDVLALALDQGVDIDARNLEALHQLRKLRLHRLRCRLNSSVIGSSLGSSSLARRNALTVGARPFACNALRL